MRTAIIFVCVCAVVSALSFQSGKRFEQKETAIKKAEIMKNVAKKRAKIQAKPNSRRSELLELMRRGEL